MAFWPFFFKKRKIWLSFVWAAIGAAIPPIVGACRTYRNNDWGFLYYLMVLGIGILGLLAVVALVQGARDGLFFRQKNRVFFAWGFILLRLVLSAAGVAATCAVYVLLCESFASH